MTEYIFLGKQQRPFLLLQRAFMGKQVRAKDPAKQLYRVTGGERPVEEELPRNFVIDTPWGNRWLNGATELHRLAVEDFVQLERRTEEIKEANINATCWLDSVGAKNIGRLKEVRQPPSPSPPR